MNLIQRYDYLTGKTRPLASIPYLVARLSIGALFMITGHGKLTHLEKVTAYFTDLGIPFPEFNAPFVAFCEFTCGALVFVGAFTEIVSVPLIVIMIVAIVSARLKDVHSFNDLVGLQEFLMGLFLLLFFLAGAGRFSVDEMRRNGTFRSRRFSSAGRKLIYE